METAIKMVFSIAEIGPDTSHQDLGLLLARAEIASQRRQGKWFDAFAPLLELIPAERFLSGSFGHIPIGTFVW